MGCYFLLQGVFQTQGSNPGLLIKGRFFTIYPTREAPEVKTAAQETVPQIALRICFKEIGGKDSIYVILVKEEYMQLSTFLVCVEFLLVFC